MRCSWKSTLKLGLVRIPVKGFTAATSAGEVHLNQLHAGCLQRVGYKKTCPKHGEIANDEICQGFEVAPGKFLVIRPEDLEAEEGARELNVQAFAPPDQVPVYHLAGKHYLLTPDGPLAPVPYALFRDQLWARKRVALAQGVLHGREQLLLIQAQGALLVVSTMHWADQVQMGQDLEVPAASTARLDAQLMRQLIDERTGDLDLQSRCDPHQRRLRQFIADRQAGKPARRRTLPAAPAGPELSLTAALEGSRKAGGRRAAAAAR